MKAYGFWLCNLCKLALNWGLYICRKISVDCGENNIVTDSLLLMDKWYLEV